MSAQQPLIAFARNQDMDALTRLRKRYLQALAIVAIGVIVASTLSSSIASGRVANLTNAAVALLACVVVLLLVRFGRITIASAILIAAGCGFILFLTTMGYLLAGLIIAISAAALGNRIVFWLTNGFLLAKAAYDIYGMLQLAPAGGIPDDARNMMLIVIGLAIVSISTRYFINQTQASTESAKANASLLSAVAESGEMLAKVLNLNELMPRAVDLIRERFAFYHVQIFLIDELGEYATLAASTGATGQKLMERRHKLAVGSQSVIGRVTASGQAVIARDTDPIYYRNELLPNTRAELALPITDGDKIIGALDVQSRRSDAFDVEAIQALQIMANLLGTSIRNARLFENQARSARETKRLFLEAETSLREIQRLNQQLTRQGWEAYLKNRRQSTGVTFEEDQLIPESEWSDALAKASHSRQVVTDMSSGSPVIAVPVMLGSEVIGAIEVEPGTPGQEAETVEMVKAIAQRLALSLDKARLYEESQEATAQEQAINDIVGRYQSVTNVDDLLRITLSELSASLGAKRGAIRLGTVPAVSLNGEAH